MGQAVNSDSQVWNSGAVTLARDGYVATVTINRPEVRNAVDRHTAQALADAFRVIEADPEIRVAVLWGAGGVFCAGADLVALSQGRGNRVETEGDGPMGPSRMLLAKPVIAAVSGHAVAGGLELACWCDLRVIDETAIFGVFCRRWGVPLIDGGTVRLPRLIGHSRALDMILTGRSVDASEALAFGLANRVVRTGCELAEAQRLAATIASFPQQTMLSDRASSYDQFAMTLDRALRHEFALGIPNLGQAQSGAALFARGHGRHGVFDGS